VQRRAEKRRSRPSALDGLVFASRRSAAPGQPRGAVTPPAISFVVTAISIDKVKIWRDVDFEKQTFARRDSLRASVQLFFKYRAEASISRIIHRNFGFTSG
jgi:hypothetical protein